MEIKNRYNDKIIHSGDFKTMKELVEDAVKNKIYLRDADLRRAYLREADLEDADLNEADLNKANLRDADLNEADLRDANLRDANLSSANLRKANLREADLCGANLREADLCGADLRGANLCGANLCGADLEGVDLDFSCLPLWCGGLNFKIDEKTAKQIMYHAFSLSEKFCTPTKRQEKFINDFHRVTKDELPKIQGKNNEVKRTNNLS